MIVSVHLADVPRRTALRAVRRGLDRNDVSGLQYAETMVAAPLGPRLLPRPNLGRVGMIAAWKDEDALEGFLASNALAKQLAHGWRAHLEPLRAVGSWTGLPDFPPREQAVEPHEPVAVLTLGRLRTSRAPAFLRASSSAEGQAVEDAALLAATGLARPGLVATLSLWRTAEAMRDYATGRSGDGHSAALRANGQRPFHRESIFMRFRPLASDGQWDGRDPLARAAAEDVS